MANTETNVSIVHIRPIKITSPNYGIQRTSFITSDVGPVWQVIKRGDVTSEMHQVVGARLYAPKYKGK